VIEKLFDIALIFVGFFVGIAVGLSGIGGAAITTPFLILIGFPPINAVGSGLVFNVVTKSFGSALYIKRHILSYEIVKRLLIGSIPAFLLGAILIESVRETLGWKILNYSIAILVAILLMVISIIYLVNTKKERFTEVSLKDEKNKVKSLWSIPIGFSVGLLLQLTSIGTGSLVMPYLMKLLNSPRKMVGTSILYGLIASIFASILHISLDTIRFDIVMLLLIGSIPGILFGIKFNDRIQINQLRYILSLLILASAILILIKTIITKDYFLLLEILTCARAE